MTDQQNEPQEISLIRVSEMGAYSYCQRQWWLMYVEGIRPVDTPLPKSKSTQSAFKAGTRYHEAHAETVNRIEKQEAAAVILLALIVAGIAGWVFAWLIA